MSELLCPICSGKLEKSYNGGVFCANLDCELADTILGIEVVKIWADTKKKLNIAVNALNKIANTDIKVIEKEPLYYARAMFWVTNNALGRIQDIKQKDVK